MIKKKRKLKWKTIITVSLIIVFLITLTISTIDIIKWKLDSDKTDKQRNKII